MLLEYRNIQDWSDIGMRLGPLYLSNYIALNPAQIKRSQDNHKVYSITCKRYRRAGNSSLTRPAGRGQATWQPLRYRRSGPPA